MREETFKRQKDAGVVPQNAKLTPRPKEIPAWDSLSADQKRLFARMMEVYAGALSHCDHQIGRVIDAIEQMVELDNTLVIYIMGDNGASGEGTLQGLTNEIAALQGSVTEDLSFLLSMYDKLGGPEAFNHYPVGWAWAMNTPFKWTKQIASHFGGIRNGLVISYPKRIKDKGGIRPQFHHVIDVVPTILEAIGVDQPKVVNGTEQKPMEGVSMVYAFDDAKAKSKRTTQYFEMFANRGIYHDGWFASCMRAVPWIAIRKPVDLATLPWELYRIEEDYSQADDLAAKYPEKLKEMQDLFLSEAEKYNVLPLDPRASDRSIGANLPRLTTGRDTFTYYEGMTRLPEGSAPDIKNRSYTVTALVDIPAGGADGTLIAQGGRFAGWSLYLKDGKLNYTHNWIQKELYTVTSTDNIPAGKSELKLEFDYDGGDIGKGGKVKLYRDSRKIGEGRVERTVPLLFSFEETLDVGEDTGTPVSEVYGSPNKFTGKIEKITLHVKDYDLRLKLKFLEMMRKAK